MIKPTLPLLFAATLLCVRPAAAAETPSPDPYAHETAAQRDARLQWWREARFGMFIHWGVYAVPAGVYHNQQSKGDFSQGAGEWLMHDARIPMAEYRSYAPQFNPVNYNPEEWVQLAKEAGMKYIVITAKHHDGFALYGSQASDWNIVKATPYAKEVLEPLAAACRKYGLKLGFYYSQAQDWNNGGAAMGGKWDPAQQHSMDDYIDQVAVPQMRELLTRYGEFPAVIWWDTPEDMNPERAGKLIELLKLKPGIIHNNRLGGGFKGDTETPEQYIPATGFGNRDWETCMTMNNTWGFKTHDTNWKSSPMLIRNLVDIASKGGNYLLNVGPTSEGLIPEASIERLHDIGRWMKINGAAIYGTTASPFPRLDWGRCTKKVAGDQTTLYLHVFNWPTNRTLQVPGLKNRVTSARLLATGKRLKARATDDGVSLTVPAQAPDSISSTVVLEIQGAPAVERPQAVQAANGSITLRAIDAETHGQLQYESGNGKDNIGYWTDASDYVDWTFKVVRPGKYSVSAEIAAPGEPRFEVAQGGAVLEGAAPNTGSYTQFKRIELPGTIEFTAAGQMTLSVKPVQQNWQPMNLRAITLKPVSQ